MTLKSLYKVVLKNVIWEIEKINVKVEILFKKAAKKCFYLPEKRHFGFPVQDTYMNIHELLKIPILFYFNFFCISQQRSRFLKRGGFKIALPKLDISLLNRGCSHDNLHAKFSELRHVE